MHNLASNDKHSHGVEGSETSLLQCFAAACQLQSQLSAVNLRLSGLLLCTLCQSYNAIRVCDSVTYKALFLSRLGAKDTTQSLWETLVSLLKKCCCHEKCCGCVGCAAV